MNSIGCIIIDVLEYSGRRGGLIVSALVPRASGAGSSPGRGHCVGFLGKTQKNCGGMTCDGLASHPGGVEILLALHATETGDKLRQL